MSRIRITIAAGAGAGQQMLFDPPRVRFGRSLDNDVVIDLDAVSRRHGELVYERGAWHVHNHSPNGTKLGRRSVGHRPRPVKGMKTLRVGGLALMRVETDPVVGGGVGPESDAEDAPGASGERETDRDASRLSGRARLWLGIAAFWGVLLALGVVLSSLDPGGGAADAGVQRLSRERIESIITAPVEVASIDERRRNAALERARRHYALLESDPGALHACYRAYRRAKALSPRAALPAPLDELRYREVVTRLLEVVLEGYERAYTDFRSGRYLAAERAWRELVERFPDPGSPLFENAQAFLRAARQRTR